MPIRRLEDGVELRVKVTPRGGRDTITGLTTGPAGETWLAVRVRAAPSDGEANEAVLALLATVLGVGRSRCVLAAGGTSRWKRVRVGGSPCGLERALGAVLATLDQAR